MAAEQGGGVTVSADRIYSLVLETHSMVSSVKQTLDERVLPTLAEHDEALPKKVDRADYLEHVKKVAAIEMRMYAAIIGVLMAAAGLNVAGVI